MFFSLKHLLETVSPFVFGTHSVLACQFFLGPRAPGNRRFGIRAVVIDWARFLLIRYEHPISSFESESAIHPWADTFYAHASGPEQDTSDTDC